MGDFNFTEPGPPPRPPPMSFPSTTTAPPVPSRMHLDFTNLVNPMQEPDQKYMEEMEREGSGVLLLPGMATPIRARAEDLVKIVDIGAGASGQVSKMRLKTHHDAHVLMAVKTMQRTPDPSGRNAIIRDLKVVAKVKDCPYIVTCYGYFITHIQVKVCMELMAYGLDKLLKAKEPELNPFPEKIVGKMSVAIITALDYLKEHHKIIHRDVKPSNILVSWNGDVKLCDFGISGELIESRAHTICAGCLPYMGPERFENQHRNNYDVRSDIWAVGITLVEISTGLYPYSGNAEFEILSSIIENPAPSLKPEQGFSPELCDFVFLCLQKEYEKRPKYNVLLQHPFIKSHIPTDERMQQEYDKIMNQWLDSINNADCE